MQPVRRFTRNLTGSDFIIGDIQGCFDALERLLEELCFSEETDRLFTTGNLIGAGRENHRIVDFINSPWFHSVIGNNEYRFENHWSYTPKDRSTMYQFAPWCEQLSGWQLANLAESFAKLPIAIEIVTADGLIGIVHGDCNNSSWKMFTRGLCESAEDQECSTNRTTYRALFGRERYIKKDDSSISDIYRLFVGHSPVKRITQMGNVFFMDTASALSGLLCGINLTSGSTHVAKISV